MVNRIQHMRRLGVIASQMVVPAGGGGSYAYDTAAWLHCCALLDTGFASLADNTQVAQWNDGSGNGRHLVMANATYKPYYRTNVGGKPAVQFGVGGVKQFFDVPSAIGSLTAAHLVAVMEVDADPPTTSDGKWHGLHMGGASHAHWPRNTDGKILESFGSNSRADCGNPTPALTTTRLYEIITTSSEYTILLDTVQLFTRATNTVGWASEKTLGGLLAAGFMVGKIREWRIYPTKRSTTRQAEIAAELKAKWSLTGY